MRELLAPTPVQTVRLGEELTIKRLPDGGILLQQDGDLVYILPEDVPAVRAALGDEEEEGRCSS